MATTARNTGTHFRYDADEALWEVKMRMKVITDGILRFEEFVTKVATFAEVVLFIADVIAAVGARGGTTDGGETAQDVKILLASLRDQLPGT